MTHILLIMFTAILVENFVLSRFLGICSFLGVSDNPGTAFGMGCAVAFVMTLASAVTNLVYNFILVPFELKYLQTIAFILVIAVLVQFIEMFLHRYVPVLYGALGIYLPLIATNCAVLGAALLSVQKNYSFIDSVVFGFSAAAGYTLAIVIFAGVRARVAFAEPPKSFEGMPIALVTASLIAMAFSVFSGVNLGI